MKSYRVRCGYCRPSSRRNGNPYRACPRHEKLHAVDGLPDGLPLRVAIRRANEIMAVSR